MKKQYNILLFLFLIPFLGFSNDDFTYSKQRNIRKAYIVNSDAGINIDNSYGTIFVTTWEEDKIEIDVLIKVSGDSEKWVNQKLAGIDVDFIALKSDEHLVKMNVRYKQFLKLYKEKRNCSELILYNFCNPNSPQEARSLYLLFANNLI